MRKFKVTVNGKAYEVEVEEIGGSPQVAKVYEMPKAAPVTAGTPMAAAIANTPPPTAKSSGKDVTAPIPGKILRIPVTKGQKISTGDLILVIEAMKMENEVLADEPAIVADILVKEGDTVTTGAVLVKLA
ncbi:MAG: biotin/lipoyl-binding protein [Caldiserica bacterium]|nr:biotin/lipoyl-binding protein [Caldisericota bacterium]